MLNLPIPLFARCLFAETGHSPLIARVSCSPVAESEGPTVLVTEVGLVNPEWHRDHAALLLRGGSESLQQEGRIVGILPDPLQHLEDGDVIRLDTIAGTIHVLYRRRSEDNSVLLTERCNCYCIMCSQPPQDRDDSYLVSDILEAIPLMDPATRSLGLTGGEPTLIGDSLSEILDSCEQSLPNTEIQILTNGRRLANYQFARRLLAKSRPNVLWAVPLCCDLPERHNFIMQADRGFDEAVRGILNLQRFGHRVEVRVVLHRQSYERLPQFARWISRNLPFVDHVALMGLEMMGHVKMNLESLWIDPAEYQQELASCVSTLERAGMPVSIYNHQLCILLPELRRFAAQSISDWKNVYLPACEGCSARSVCGGFFASADLRYSDSIQPLSKAIVQEFTGYAGYGEQETEEEDI